MFQSKDAQMLQESQIKCMAPKIENFTSAVEFLKSYYYYKKSLIPGFSFDAWSSEAGLKSRSYLKMIIDRKRNLTSEVVAKISHTLSLNEYEIDYFSLLAKADQASDENEKSLFLNRALEMKGAFKKVVEVKRYSEFLSSLVLPQLQVLLSFNDLNRTAEGLSAFLNLPLNTTKQYLKKLEELGLASVTLDNVWSAKEASFLVPQHLGQPALRKYHDQCLDEAKASQDLPVESRRFKSILLALSENEKNTFIEEINNFISKALAKYDSAEFNNKQLFKLNLNIYPTTKPFTKPRT